MAKTSEKDRAERPTGLRSDDRGLHSLGEVKDFILWAKEQKIKKVSFENVSVEFSDIAFIEDRVLTPLEVEEKDAESQKKEFYEDLFYSAT